MNTKKLKRLSAQRQKSIGELIRETVEKSLLLTKEKTPFDNLKGFGIWANDTRSDQETLGDIGGNWLDFPLNE